MAKKKATHEEEDMESRGAPKKSRTDNQSRRTEGVKNPPAGERENRAREGVTNPPFTERRPSEAIATLHEKYAEKYNKCKKNQNYVHVSNLEL